MTSRVATAAPPQTAFPSRDYPRLAYAGAARAARRRPAVVENGVLGIVLFLATELMLFAGFISALLVLRAGAMDWPPPGQPRLPVLMTAINTVVLLVSAATMLRARTAICAGSARRCARWLLATALLGGAFLVVQGTEWVRLVGYGLYATSGTYGATFYTLIGAHALHVLGAVAALLVVLARAWQGRYSADHHTGVDVCQLYWLFVVGIWPVLYVLVYLV